MGFAVEMTISEDGLVKERLGYLRDTNIEVKDLLKWTKEQLVIISDVTLRDEQARGFDKNPIIIVDGKRNKVPDQVNPWGQIEFVSRLADIGQPIAEAYKYLLDLSKVLTGRYKSSHVVSYNGEQIASSLRELEVWLAYKIEEIKTGDIIRIVNTQPYARRLELLGVTADRQQNRRSTRTRKKKKILIRVPNGAYQLAYRRINSKYGKQMGIRFQFIPGNALGLSGSFRTGRKNSIGRPYLYPAITFKVQGIANV